jgi:hypothetical protein
VARTARDEVLARVAWAARVIRRFSTWGAAAGLVAGALALGAVLPWLPRTGPWWPAVAAALTAALVVAPLRVMWHGHRIHTVFGNPAEITAIIDDLPELIGELSAALHEVSVPRRGRLRRVIPAWRSLVAVRRVVLDSPVSHRIEFVLAPLRPEALGLTTVALWATVVILAAAVPVAVLSLLAALVV